jgi:hypothetical protein
VCRRNAEYRLRRVQSLLRRAETRVQDMGAAVVRAEQRWGRAEAEKLLAYWTAEVERLRDELRRLLAAEPPPADPGEMFSTSA